METNANTYFSKEHSKLFGNVRLVYVEFTENQKRNKAS